MNKCAVDVWDAIKTASADLKKQKTHHALMGTNALRALGYDVDAADVDFYIDVAPAKKLRGQSYDEIFGATNIVVQLIPVATTKWAFFFTTDPIEIDGVPVANVEDILKAKRAASRPKDIAFLEDFFARYPAGRHLIELDF